MKIVCDSCGAKYSIADEKIAGKVFKIRCKKCSSVIVVRGDQIGADEQQDATKVFDYGSDAVWHVVIDGDQQGPFTAQDIGGLLTEARIDWEAYIWREGFDGWKAVRDIPELVQEITGGAQPSGHAEAAHESAPPAAQHDPYAAQQPAAHEPPAAAAPSGADPFGGGPDLFAGAAAPAAAHQAFSIDDDEATRAVASPMMGMEGGAGADLFAQQPAAADAGFGAPGSEGFGEAEGADPLGGIGSPHAHPVASFSGQRNENSVLFSLNNLKALATGGAAEQAASSSGVQQPAAVGGGQPAGIPVSEGSGLIDIRALASASATAQTSQPRNTADALLSIGTGSPALGGALGSPLLAPVEEPQSSKSSMWLIIAAVAVLAAGGLVGFLVLTGSDEPPVAQNAPIGTTTTAQGTTPTEAPVPPPPNPAGDTPTGATAENTEQAAGTPTEAVAAEEAEPEQDLTEAQRRVIEERRIAAREARAAEQAARPSEPTTIPPREPAMTTMMSNVSSGNLDDFLNMALSSMSSSMMAAAPAMAASNLAQAPSRGQVASALRGVSGRVARCGGGQGGTVNVRVTVSGQTGRVTGANVSGAPNAQVRSCVSAAVRGARFPRFQEATFTVTFPYRLN